MSNQYAFVFFLLQGSGFLGSCKKDGDPTPACTAPTVDKNIVGTWSVTMSGLGQTETGKATFKSDGTYDDNGLLLEGGVNGQTFNTRTYEVKNNQVTLKLSGSGGSISTSLDVKSNECSKIVLSLAGLATVTMTR
jgi:hypothetical protein